jgi:hypothetical protein
MRTLLVNLFGNPTTEERLRISATKEKVVVRPGMAVPTFSIRGGVATEREFVTPEGVSCDGLGRPKGEMAEPPRASAKKKRTPSPAPK